MKFLNILFLCCVFAGFSLAQNSNQPSEPLLFKARIGFDDAKERIIGQKFFDDDKKLVLIGIKSIQFWDVTKGKLLESHPHEIPNLSDTDSVITVSPDGQKAIVLDSLSWRLIRKEKKVSATVWDLQTGRQITVLERPTESIRAAGWSKNGETLVTYSGEFSDKRTEVCFWDGNDFKLRAAVLLQGYVNYKKLTDDGKVFLAKTDKMESYKFRYDSGDYLSARDTTTAKLVQNFSSGGEVQALSYGTGLTENQEYVVMSAGKYDRQRVSVWKMGGSDLPIYEISPEKKGGTIDLLSVVGDYFVIYQNKKLEVYNAADGKIKLTIPNQKRFTGNFRSFELSPDKRTLVINDCNRAEFYDVAAAQRKFEMDLVCKTDFDFVSTSYRDFDVLRFQPNGNLLLTASDKTVRLWNAEDGRLLQTLADPNRIENKKKDKNKDDGLSWLAGWIRNGDFLFAFGADDKTILLWEMKK